MKCLLCIGPSHFSSFYEFFLQGFSDGQKVREIVYSLDEDNDGAADPWELHDWIVWVEKIVHRHVLNEQWEELRLGNNNQSDARTLSWGDYQVCSLGSVRFAMSNLQDKTS